MVGNVALEENNFEDSLVSMLIAFTEVSGYIGLEDEPLGVDESYLARQYDNVCLNTGLYHDILFRKRSLDSKLDLEACKENIFSHFKITESQAGFYVLEKKGLNFHEMTKQERFGCFNDIMQKEGTCFGFYHNRNNALTNLKKYFKNDFR